MKIHLTEIGNLEGKLLFIFSGKIFLIAFFF